MHIKSAKLIFYISHASSLKDKRQICRKLIDKARHKFNASIAEVCTQDFHQTLTIGIAIVGGEMAFLQKFMDEIIRFMEEVAEILGAELTQIDVY